MWPGRRVCHLMPSGAFPKLSQGPELEGDPKGHREHLVGPWWPQDSLELAILCHS